MHPTLRPAIALFQRIFGGKSSDSAGRRSQRQRTRRSLEPQLAPLESRQLLYFSPAIATAVPSTLWPPNGQYVPVTISGQFKEFKLVNNKPVFTLLPGPKQSSFFIVDEYGRDEPRGPVHLTNQGGGVFTYSFTVHLQASRSTQFQAGRRYYVTVAAEDSDGWSGRTIPVQVPVSLTNRGPGPIVGKPAPHAARGHAK